MNVLIPGTYKIAGTFFTVHSNGDYVHYDTGEIINDRVGIIQQEDGIIPEIASEKEAEEAYQALMEGFKR